MRRAVLLILAMTLLGVAAGVWMEHSLCRICEGYLETAARLRVLVAEGRLEEALEEQQLLYGLWQREERRLKAMVSHHHTRAASEALLRLGTALAEGWRKEALLALDAFHDALADLESDMRLLWENVL